MLKDEYKINQDTLSLTFLLTFSIKTHPHKTHPHLPIPPHTQLYFLPLFLAPTVVSQQQSCSVIATELGTRCQKCHPHIVRRTASLPTPLHGVPHPLLDRHPCCLDMSSKEHITKVRKGQDRTQHTTWTVGLGDRYTGRWTRTQYLETALSKSTTNTPPGSGQHKTQIPSLTFRYPSS